MARVSILRPGICHRCAATMLCAAVLVLRGESSCMVISIAGIRNIVDPITHMNAPAAI